MRYAFVTHNLVDLWAEPKFNSERSSQLLLATILTTHASQNGFSRVRQADGYEGWVDERFLKLISKGAAESYAQSAKGIVTAMRLAVVRPKVYQRYPPYFVHYGTQLQVSSWRGDLVAAILPDESVLHLRKTGVKRITSSTAPLSGGSLTREARRHLGSSYLWGGVTPFGFDCSGLVQAIYAQYGLHVPRDTKDQIRIGESVDRAKIKGGDLLFFDRHVAIALRSKNRYIHASAGGGGVRENSFDPHDPDYRADLDHTLREVRRFL